MLAAICAQASELWPASDRNEHGKCACRMPESADALRRNVVVADQAFSM
jgi:hypothetical protein